jgi:hypothetical protein
MKYAVEMGSGVMIYIPVFIKTGSSIQKVTGGFTDTRTALRKQENYFTKVG